MLKYIPTNPRPKTLHFRGPRKEEKMNFVFYSKTTAATKLPSRPTGAAACTEAAPFAAPGLAAGELVAAGGAVVLLGPMPREGHETTLGTVTPLAAQSWPAKSMAFFWSSGPQPSGAPMQHDTSWMKVPLEQMHLASLLQPVAPRSFVAQVVYREGGVC